jgi:hypothetical protein
MSWETLTVNKYPCPCGKGEYEVELRSDDWNRFESNYTMLCKNCKELYYYSHKVVHGHPGDFIEEGWVLKKEKIKYYVNLPHVVTLKK